MKRSLQFNGVTLGLICLLLLACGDPASTRDKYKNRALELLNSGNIEKAGVEIRNAIQIDGNDADARFILAQVQQNIGNVDAALSNYAMAIELDAEHTRSRFELGTILLANNYLDGAQEQATAILSYDENSADAHALQAAIHVQLDDRELARASAEHALEIDPEHIAALTVLTELFKDTDPTIPLQSLEKALARNAEIPMARLLQISVLNAIGEHAEASRQFQLLRDAHPDNFFFFYLHATHLNTHGDSAGAERMLREAVTLNPDSIEMKLWLAQFLANHRDLSVAQAALERFVAQTPDDMRLRRSLIQVYLSQQDLESARGVYESLLDERFGSANAISARTSLAELELSVGNRSRAETLIQEVLEVEPQNEAAQILIARLALVDGDAEGAAAATRAVLRSAPDSVPGRLLLARAQELQGATDLAIDNYRAVVDEDGDNQTALQALTRIALASGDTESATEVANHALVRNPNNTEAIKLLVRGYIERERYHDALVHARRLSENPQTRVLGTYFIGRIHQAQEQWELAATALTQAFQQEPRLIEALRNLAAVYVRLDRSQEAVEIVTRHIEAYPEHRHAYEVLARLYAGAGYPLEAEKALLALLSIAPDDPEVHVLVGDFYLTVGSLDRAKATYTNGLNNVPEHVGLLVRSGQISELERDYDAAIRYYESSLLLGKSEVASNNLSMLLADHRPTPENLTRALTMIKEHAYSRNPSILDTLGWVLYRMEDYEQAVEVLEQAQSAGGQDLVIAYHLGMAYARTGRFLPARIQLQRVVDSGGSFYAVEEARETLANLHEGMTTSS